MEEYMIPCLFKWSTGIPCPGCGGQRSVAFLLKGEFTDAFLSYPAIYPMLILGILIFSNLVFPYKAYSKLSFPTGIITVVAILTHYIFELVTVFS